MKFLPLPREKRRLLDPLGRTALTCLLTAGSFGGLCAPLPLALTAAAGPGLPGLCCVLGCGAGAFLFLPFQAGLRQLAAAILIFSGSIAFYDTRLFARRAFRPGLAAALLLLVQSAYLIARPAQLWGLCVFCMAAVAAVTDLLLRRRDRLPLLLAAGVCLAAGRVSLSGVSPGMCLAAALLIRSVRELEPVRAAAWGAAVGLCMGLLPLPRLTPAAEKKEPLPEKRPLQDRFAKPAAALRDLYDSFFRGTAPEKPENPSVLFDRAAEQVCRRCILRDTCWRQNYSATYNAFNDACPRLLQRGEAQAGDFPLYFTSRCVHLSDFVGAVNVELRSYLLRQQYHRRLSEVRDQAREQYAQLGDLLASAGPAVPASAQAMGYRVASSLRPREGQNVCGDQLDSFEVGGAVYLLLSDGMGSGEAAHREAAMTVRLLRQFLEAGIEPGPALKTLNTALSLRGESGGGFTTIDLLALQRSSGQAALYKYGAAPSYCKRGGSVSRYAGQSLPAGLQAVRDAPECTRLQLTAGSFFVMVSDGIADAGNDEWLQNLLAGWSGRDVNALVSLILAESRGRKGLEDDCAVLALHLSSGEKKPV